MITINLERAKEIHRQNIRFARKEILERKDVEFMRAVEKGDTETQRLISEEKQRLRDATQSDAINAASSVEDLKNSWDESLLGANPYRMN